MKNRKNTKKLPFVVVARREKPRLAVKINLVTNDYGQMPDVTFPANNENASSARGTASSLTPAIKLKVSFFKDTGFSEQVVLQHFFVNNNK
jgi:hypothetical protein